MIKTQVDYKEKHKLAVKMFMDNKTVDEVSTTLKIGRYRVVKWKTGFKKLQLHNLKQRFKTEYADGRKTVMELATLYGLKRRTVLMWKIEIFGKGSLRQRLIYQLHISGFAPRNIANIYCIHVEAVHRSIRNERENLL